MPRITTSIISISILTVIVILKREREREREKERDRERQIIRLYCYRDCRGICSVLTSGCHHQDPRQQT